MWIKHFNPGVHGKSGSQRAAWNRLSMKSFTVLPEGGHKMLHTHDDETMISPCVSD